MDKIPTIHMGVSAMQMEKRGIRTMKGDANRQIAADNKLLKEIKARITRIYNWSKEQAARPDGKNSIMVQLWQAQQGFDRPSTQKGKLKRLREDVTLFNLLQANNIRSMQELYETVSKMNSDYYELRGKIVGAERRIAALNKHLEMLTQYQETKAVRKKLDTLKPKKQAAFAEAHRAELIKFNAAKKYLDELIASGEKITPKGWQKELTLLGAQKDLDYIEMRKMRDKIKAVENLRKTAERLARENQPEHKQRENER